MSSDKIAELNDNLRKTGVGGKMLITAGVKARGKDFIHRAVKANADF